ncbi:galactose oxidase-like domain-containing protein [Myxococcus stipitatus]|uniref:galactose oxidase-like domain-containing protein n=1 Tax=Myxococcus stipitatus TaxID=83455 RepID=UPI0030D61270
MPQHRFISCPNPRTFWWLALAVLPALAQAQTPAQVGSWSSLMTWPISATHTSLLPDGKVMFIGEYEQGALPPRRWDPSTGALTTFPYVGYNIFCSGHSFLSNGKLFYSGGHIAVDVGRTNTSSFDFNTSSWTQGPTMNAGRWYPSNTTLNNGDVVIVSGEMNGPGDINLIPQRYIAATNTLRTLTSASMNVPFYPKNFLAPNGKVFYAGSLRRSMWLDPTGNGAWSNGPNSNYGTRSYGPAVYIDGKVYLIGGSQPPTETVEVLDLNAATPTWQYVAPMSIRRRQHNAVLLPDATIAVFGGSSGSGFNDSNFPVNYVEVYNPATNSWTSMASAATYRGYHSTAVLLPDGRVLSAGGYMDTTAQVFSPPYLFKGARPTIASAPTTSLPGAQFTITTPDAANISRVSLIALNSTTHTFDMNQRFLTLAFTRGAGSLNVTAPPNRNVAPPGYYQLFIVNNAGVPSVGKRLRIPPP